MEKTTKQSERWWRVPLLGILFVLMMSFVPQGAQAKYSNVDGTGFFWDYFINDLKYDANTCTVTFTSQYCHQYMASFDEGFYSSQGLTFYARKDGAYAYEKGWTELGTIKITTGTHDITMTKVENDFDIDKNTPATTLHEGLTAADQKPYGYNYIRTFKWVLPIQWRNCRIYFMAKGTWTDKDGTTDPHDVNSFKDGQERFDSGCI